MLHKLIPFAFIILVFACEEKQPISSIEPVNWKKRSMKTTISDSLEYGTTYLSVYSQIYSQNEHRTLNLTATVSMRNTNKNDTIYIDRAEYYDTHGKLIRSYFDHTIFIRPMETVEIVIDEIDDEGGTGANFVFEWKIKASTNEPLFESVMISTYGQQGLSFTTTGKRIK